ncbi:MAG: formate transporter FocA [Anaerolineales bacterium]|nr:MAG: formate transporter FocA [Anaerolineales bacterium]
MQTFPSFDPWLPPEMAAKAEDVGVSKASLGFYRMFFLAVLAGAFIAMGAVFSTMATTGAGDLPFGMTRVIGGLTFSLGLILVVVAGAELFTGNNLIVMAWASRKIRTAQLLRNWFIVYIGNFLGSILTAYMMYLTKQYTFGKGTLGLNALTIAHAKVNLEFLQALVLGIFCNALVCLAVWLCISARTDTDKVLLIIPPITAFVAAGFEHSIANMYFIPVALFIKSGASAEFWDLIGRTAVDFPNLTWGNFFLANLLPVTIGNIIGGAVMVGLVYWSIYLWPAWRKRPSLRSLLRVPFQETDSTSLLK